MRSATWIKIKAVCKCGKEFETGHWEKDGAVLSKDGEACRECAEKQFAVQRIKDGEAKLPAIIKETKEEWLYNCGLKDKYREKTFANFNQKAQPAAYKVMKAYDGTRSIILSSPDLYGVGKTHLVAALINQLIENANGAHLDKFGEIHCHWNPIEFTTESEILNRLRATYNHHREDERHHETEEEVYRSLMSIRHLFIDDVGKIRPYDYSFLQGVYYQIIDSRYCSDAPIVITTNLSLEELEKHIGGACADRLREMCGKENIITMTGKSQRK